MRNHSRPQFSKVWRREAAHKLASRYGQDLDSMSASKQKGWRKAAYEEAAFGYVKTMPEPMFTLEEIEYATDLIKSLKR